MTIQHLLELLKKGDRIFIQTHNYPDPDAVAAAFGLHTLLSSQGFFALMVFDGEIRRTSLDRMIHSLKIPILHRSQYSFSLSDKVILVDGCKGNSNVTPLPGEVIAIIDHHSTSRPSAVPFADIRPDLGACSTLIFQYFQALALPVPGPTATALMIGINIDTAHLTRETTTTDIEAYAQLFRDADMNLVNSIIRNNSQKSDLMYYRYAIDHLSFADQFAFCFFPQGCDQNLLGILADFILGIDEVDFVAVAARNHGHIDISLRSEHERFFCADVLARALGSYGSSGGHREMAGGCLYLDRYDHPTDVPEALLEKRFREAVREALGKEIETTGGESAHIPTEPGPISPELPVGDDGREKTVTRENPARRSR